MHELSCHREVCGSSVRIRSPVPELSSSPSVVERVAESSVAGNRSLGLGVAAAAERRCRCRVVSVFDAVWRPRCQPLLWELPLGTRPSAAGER